ncbi:MAG: PcfB family protein [Oscillospiraceae bacterium]|nr:PcfB family protein [Oscillospiraceae bacterium]
MDLQHDLEAKTEQAAKEAALKSKQLFVFIVKAEAEILKGVFNVATFFPKQIINGFAEKSEEVYKGKQTIKQLVGSGAKLDNIPIDKDKMGLFDSVARSYGVDYSIKKSAEVSGESKPRCYVFFKAKDMQVLQSAFKEFAAKVVDNERKKSVKERIKEDRAQAKTQNRERSREKKRSREAEL